MNYTNSTFSYHRVKTKEVQIGDIAIGNGLPIRIQSMTNTDTNDVDATVRQIIELEEAGCEIVRITVPSITAANNTEKIMNKIRQQNVKVPIVADIHFTPNAAMKVIDFVEKVRINPGNYADKKKFEVLTYTDDAYQAELNRIEDKFSPLIEKAISLKRAIRIGTNHGSLSDRIMNRFGDSPEGMVESAWEFAKICQNMDFHNFVFSMKASNPQVMIQAYRLLQNRMMNENLIYPLHLGVTEAGDGIDGRIKSYIGIGALLDDGLGDTIRVSLTESPVKEVPVAQNLADYYNRKSNTEPLIFDEVRDPIHFSKRDTFAAQSVGADKLCAVIQNTSKSVSKLSDEQLRHLKVFDLQTNVQFDKVILNVNTDDDIQSLNTIVSKDVLTQEKIIVRARPEYSPQLKDFDRCIQYSLGELSSVQSFPHMIEIQIGDSSLENIREHLSKIALPEQCSITFSTGATVYMYRLLAAQFKNHPIIINGEDLSNDIEEYRLLLSTQAGSLLCDGIGNGIITDSSFDYLDNLQLAFTILQGTRTRISKTEYISCPSCGRTLFDLEETTAMIKTHTNHLTGVKIAVMGCIVNGPGEMADADFGYVGSGPGKINLYVGHDLVQRNIESENAVHELIELIKSKNMWVEPE